MASSSAASVDWSVVVRSDWSAAAPVTRTSMPRAPSLPMSRSSSTASVRSSDLSEVSGTAMNATWPFRDTSPGAEPGPNGGTTRPTPSTRRAAAASLRIVARSAAVRPPERV